MALPRDDEGPARRKSSGAAFGILALMALCTARPARAQMQVEGVVRDQFSHELVEGADVALLDANGGTVAHAATSGEGRFTIKIPRAGHYQIEASALGYASFRTDGFWAGSLWQLTMNVSLVPVPVVLRGMGAVPEQVRGELQNVGFYERQKQGLGRFLGPEAVRQRSTHGLADVFYGTPGARIVSIGRGDGGKALWDVTLQGPTGGACYPAIYVDGTKVRPAGKASDRGIDTGRWSTRVGPRGVVGIEVYGSSAVPPPFAKDTGALCGAVVIWTLGQ